MGIIDGRTFLPPVYQQPSSDSERGRLKREEANLRRFQNVLVTDPHPESQASLVLLLKHYMKLDSNPVGKGIGHSTYQNYRRKFIDICKVEHGELRCYRCKAMLHEAKTTNTHKRLTVDHIIELRNGGSLCDIHNMRLACQRCNSERQSREDSL